MTTPKFFIQRDAFSMTMKVHLRLLNPDGSFAIGLPAEMWMVRPDSGGAVSEEDLQKLSRPLLEFQASDAEAAMQSLLDELWREGYRPKDIGTAGHLAATQKHLEDLRRIVFKQLGIEQP